MCLCINFKFSHHDLYLLIFNLSRLNFCFVPIKCYSIQNWFGDVFYVSYTVYYTIQYTFQFSREQMIHSKKITWYFLYAQYQILIKQKIRSRDMVIIPSWTGKEFWHVVNLNTVKIFTIFYSQSNLYFSAPLFSAM